MSTTWGVATWGVPDLATYDPWATGVLLFGAGVVMNAAGAGGGGVFVALLLSVYGLAAHEAVPMSKFVIFLSAAVTFLFNTVWRGKVAVIDFTIVRAIVPLSLAGTLIGVFINTSVSETVLLCMLSLLLIGLSVFTLRLTWRKLNTVGQYQNSNELAAQPSTCLDSPKAEHVVVVLTTEDLKPKLAEPGCADSVWGKMLGDPAERRLNVLVVGLVPLVVICGIVARTVAATGLQWMFLIVSVSACGLVAWHLRSQLPMSYSIVGLIGGIAAGVFGLGGGLIYSPFLLSMNTRPDVAVAVSSTAVLFASAATALQYLFIGRIAIATGLFFAAFGVCSAVVATRLSRVLAESTKGQYVIFTIVAIAVVTSTTVTIAKTIITFGS